MKRAVSVLIVALTLAAVAARPAAQASAGSLKGVWRVVAVTGADRKTDAAPQPGLYIFTDRHYSIQRVSAPRPTPPVQNATDKELAAAYVPFTANTGTYEVKGPVLTTRPVVAKNPNIMAGPPQQSDLRFEGASVLHVTAGAPDGARFTVKLQRLE